MPFYQAERQYVKYRKLVSVLNTFDLPNYSRSKVRLTLAHLCQKHKSQSKLSNALLLKGSYLNNSYLPANRALGEVYITLAKSLT